MKKTEMFRDLPWHSIVFLLSTLAMIGLGVAGFTVPPLGVIDPSVFKYGCLLCVPLTLSQIPFVLQEARHFKNFKTTFGSGKRSVSVETKQEEQPPSEA